MKRITFFLLLLVFSLISFSQNEENRGYRVKVGDLVPPMKAAWLKHNSGKQEQVCVCVCLHFTDRHMHWHTGEQVHCIRYAVNRLKQKPSGYYIEQSIPYINSIIRYWRLLWCKHVHTESKRDSLECNTLFIFWTMKFMQCTSPHSTK